MHNAQKTYSADFKAKIALATMKGDKTLAELAVEFAVHPDQISLWQQQLLNNIRLVFDKDDDDLDSGAKTVDNRHAKIGQLMAENDFLTKVLGR